MDLMTRRRALMARVESGGRLPAEYQEVEYLESTGTQYINTWIVGRDSIYAESRLMFTQTDFGNAGFLGSRQGGGDQRFYLISAWQGDWQLGLGEDFFSTTAVLPNTLYDIKVGRDWNTYRFALNVNGADILSGSSRIQTTYDMYVFAVNNYGTASRFCSARLYLLKISNDNSLLRDYIPCYRKSDNKPGMYDLVSDEFFTNAGTGEFLVGPDVIDNISPWLVTRRRALMARVQSGGRLPFEYQEVPCIIGQGTQYIDTGYVLNSECRVQGRYNLYNTDNMLAKVLALFGARDSNYNNAFAMFNVTSAPRIDYGKTLITHSFSYVIINNRSVVDFDLNAGIATVNGRTYAFADSLKPFTCPSTAMIFAAHTGDAIDTRCPKGEIVYLKITDENGIVVRDMVPCYRKSDNKPGMYDLANNQFYTNAGTGEFQLPT